MCGGVSALPKGNSASTLHYCSIQCSFPVREKHECFCVSKAAARILVGRFFFFLELTLTCPAETHPHTEELIYTLFWSSTSILRSFLVFGVFVCVCMTFLSPPLQMSLDLDLDGLFNQNDTYDYNESYEYKEDPDPSVSKPVWIPVLYSLVMVAGLLGNGLLMAALVLKRRAPWTASDSFVFHQSLADILLLLTLSFLVVQSFQSCGWCFTVALCKISGPVLNVSTELYTEPGRRFHGEGRPYQQRCGKFWPCTWLLVIHLCLLKTRSRPGSSYFRRLLG